MTCSEVIKTCGLKSTRFVADINGVSRRTIERAFNNDTQRFKKYILTAIDGLYEDAKSNTLQALTAITEIKESE